MSKKAILLTFVSAVAVICLAGVLSYLVWTNQPSADSNPPIPPIPGGAPTEKPPVPASPRLAGDVLDDGIVSSLDINSIVVHWKQIAPEYNLVDADSDQAGIISLLDLNQTIKYWKCTEQQGEAACPYLVSIASGTTTPITPPVPPNPADSTTATTSAVASATSSQTAPLTPPVPPVPTN